MEAKVLEAFKDAKKEARVVAKRAMMSRMVRDNILPFILPEFTIEVRMWGLKISPKSDVTMDIYDKQVAKLAKAMRKEPYTNIDEKEAKADFYFYVTKDNPKYEWDSVSVSLTCKNTEACEITYKEQVITVAELTGYCGQLSKKKYLQKVC